MRRLPLGFLFFASAFAALAPSMAGGPSPEPSSASDRSLYAAGLAWTDDSGRPVKFSDFEGQAVVLALFYSSCPSSCPATVAAMKRFQASLPGSLRARTAFVLVSIDSEHDTPAALAAYRNERALPRETWSLLHGDADSVRELAMLVGEKYRSTGPLQFAHSNLITVLNRSGEIAYQRTGLAGADAEVVEAILKADR